MNKHGLDILSWQEQQPEICARIGSEKANLKIVTKTKNEVFFLEKWIRHHKKISDGARLIIFDNMSTDDEVFEIYKKYWNDILVFSFTSEVDSIHTTYKFMDLYAILKKTCNFFTIIDSDEFLYLYDGLKLIDDSRIINILQNRTNINLFVPAWLDTIHGSENTFRFKHKELSMFNYSKPIINARMVHKFFGYYCEIHHTIKFPALVYGHAPTCFVLLHMKNLNKEQRIKANMEKLVAFGAIQDTKDFDTVLNANAEALPPGHIRGYVYEIHRLFGTHDFPVSPHIDEQSVENGLVEIGDDKSLRFFPPALKIEFTKLVSMKTDYFDLIGFDPKHVTLDSRISIKAYLESFR